MLPAPVFDNLKERCIFRRLPPSLPNLVNALHQPRKQPDKKHTGSQNKKRRADIKKRIHRLPL